MKKSVMARFAGESTWSRTRTVSPSSDCPLPVASERGNYWDSQGRVKFGRIHVLDGQTPFIFIAN